MSFHLFLFFSLPSLLTRASTISLTGHFHQLLAFILYLPLFLRDLLLQGFPNWWQALMAPPDLAVPVQSPGNRSTLVMAQDPISAPGAISPFPSDTAAELAYSSPQPCSAQPWAHLWAHLPQFLLIPHPQVHARPCPDRPMEIP